MNHRTQKHVSLENEKDAETVEAIVASTGQTVSAKCCRLRTAFGSEVAIYVDRNAEDDIARSILTQTYEFPEAYSLLRELSMPGQRILDLGAHVGTFSLYAASLGYDVMSVEAAPRNFALLDASAKKNGFTNLRLVSAAVSDHVGMLEFVDNGPHGLAIGSLPGLATVSVPAITIDDLLADTAWDSVQFIKMDIEGSEGVAIKGMARLLARDDAPMLLFEANGHTLQFFQETPEHLMEAVEAFGYQCYLVEAGRLIPSRSDKIQPGVIADYLATKRPLSKLRHWRVVQPMSSEERISRILASCDEPSPHVQSYIARALANADAELLADQRITKALERLSAKFGDETKWWRDHILSLSRDKLSQVLAAKDAEIARLSELVAGYERGRYIRLMRKLRGIAERLKF